MKEIKQIYGGYFQSTNKITNKKFSNKRITECYEIEFFDDDYFYTVINEKRLKLNSNTVIVAKPGEERYSKLHFCCYYFHLYLGDGEIKDFFDNTKPLIFVSNPEEYKTLFKKIARLSLAPNKNYYKIKAELYNFMDMLSKDVTFSKMNSNKALSVGRTAVYETAKFIENNFNLDIKLSDIAARVYMHPNYFLNLFKKYFGVSPTQYLTDTRIDNAKYLMLNTYDSVSEIASKCGFGSQTYFSFVFKKQTGKSPSEFILEYRMKT